MALAHRFIICIEISFASGVLASVL
jgi:hypothetical protein